MSNLKLLLVIAVFTLVSCAQFKDSSATEQVENKTAASIFGWFDGSCFATMENNLSPDTEILVVVLDDPQILSAAKVVGPANAQMCGPMSSDRRQQNESGGLSFYQVKSDHTFGLAIGVVGAVARASIINDVVMADLGNDGIFERFTHCATNEGISFDIWASTPYEQNPLWSGYYYLGYDVERNCP
jgi:hypothetical protein